MQFRFHLSYQITKILRCSHKDSKIFCLEGRIKVDGNVIANPREIIGNQEEIRLDDVVIREGMNLKYVLFYKPFGYECTSNRAIENNMYEILPAEYQDLFSLGRLDINSEGLLLLTNDGQTYKKMMGEESETEKEYLVSTYYPVTEALADSFRKPFLLGKRLTLPAHFEQIDAYTFKVILKEGINRHIRRICAKNQNQVKQLIRIRFGNHEPGDLKPGECRELGSF